MPTIIVEYSAQPPTTDPRMLTPQAAEGPPRVVDDHMHPPVIVGVLGMVKAT